MSIEKNERIDQISILDNGIILARLATVIIEDGATLSTAYTRMSFEPGTDLSGRDPRIQAVATAVWTPEVVTAWRQSREATA